MTRQARIDKLAKLCKMQQDAGRLIITAALRSPRKGVRVQVLCDHYETIQAAIDELLQ